MKNMKIITWTKTVKPLSDWLRANRGSLTRLAERMEKRTGIKKNWRQLIDLWLTTNEDRSVEPLYTTGTVLLEEIEKLIKETPNEKEKKVKDSAK